MANKDTNQPNWREELRQLGKSYFETLDMMRLGFLKLSPSELEYYRNKLSELKKVNGQIHKIKGELEGLEDITPILKEIRQKRIERVQKEREKRKAEKAKSEAERKAKIAQRKKTQPTFLGAKIAEGLKFQGEDEAKLQSLHLPVLKDLLDFAEAAHLSREEILWLSYHRQAAQIDHYTRFQIPKRKGGLRTIASPKSKMRLAQSWILENILSPIPCHTSATAFQASKSIADNAQLHARGELIIRLDLKDFFPSIKFPRVKGFFKSLGYSSGMATVFALICTDAARIGANLGDKKYFVALGERYLPQGACTSPALSNLICRKLDNRLHKLAQAQAWTYSRYADDLVFSHPNKEVSMGGLYQLVHKIVLEENFVINPEKTKIMRPHQRQAITGVVVNNGVLRISRRDVKRFRAFLHQYEQKGASAMTEKMKRDATQYGRGYHAFMHMINPEQAKKFSTQYPWLIAKNGI